MFKDDIDLFIPNNKCEIVTVDDILIDKITLSEYIYTILTEKEVRKNKNKVHTYNLNGDIYKINFEMNLNGNNENLPVIEIVLNDNILFRGNFYKEYIDVNIEIIKFIKNLVDKIV